jgi:hypothetical protein
MRSVLALLLIAALAAATVSAQSKYLTDLLLCDQPMNINQHALYSAS